MFTTIIAFLIVLGMLVLVHELGHFMMAKSFGVKVEEFAFGFPPRLFSFKRGETNYSINAIPFGGYVKMLGELEHSSHPRALENQSPGRRFTIAIAGVVMNLLLAWLILTIGFIAGMSPLISPTEVIPGQVLSSEVVIADIEKGTPAESANLKPGDILLSARAGSDQAQFDKIDKVGGFTRAHRGEAIEIVYRRGDDTASKEITLSSNDQTPLGVAVVEQSIIKVPWYKAPYVALRETWHVTTAMFVMIADLARAFFRSGQVSEGVGGPVAVYVYSGLALKAGFITFLKFIAMLSINLALINVLPFPALDGGRLLFIILEKIRGKKVVRESVESIIHTIGFIILIALIIAITYRDIIKLF